MSDDRIDDEADVPSGTWEMYSTQTVVLARRRRQWPPKSARGVL